MDQIAGFPFLPLSFAKDGHPSPSECEALLAAATNPGTTDILVLSHGWNNDTAEARALYSELLTNMRALLAGGHGAATRSILTVGAFWPSKRFTDDELRPHVDAGGGVAALSGAGPDLAALEGRLDELAEMLGDVEPTLVEQAKAALAQVENKAAARKTFAEKLREMLPAPTDGEDDRSDRFFNPVPDDDFVKALSEPVPLPVDDNGGGVAEASAAGGGIAGLDALWSGMKAGVWRLLNYSTYYVMKERAGIVGAALGDVLSKVRAEAPELRIHLAGHSFGARVVTAAVSTKAGLKPSSMALLQGAFSHNGFCDDIDGKAGHFRNVITERRVAGPIIATHTVNDQAVGKAYAVASRLTNDYVSAFGGPDDRFGGIGRNGAMRMREEEAVAALLEDEFHDYGDWSQAAIVNLKADRYIGDHGDVKGRQVANAMLAAMTARS